MLFELFLEGDISKTIATIHITEVDGRQTMPSDKSHHLFEIQKLST